MTLSFSTKWGKQMGELAGQPNYFVEKIMLSLYKENPKSILELDKLYQRLPNRECDSLLEIISLRKNGLFPKLHTIRYDRHSRWEVGNKIHFVINSRTKNRFQFAPVIKVKSVQEIDIEWNNRKENFSDGNILSARIFLHKNRWVKVKIDDIPMSFIEICKISENDGFHSPETFFQYFDEDFTGKIIHWTDLKY